MYCHFEFNSSSTIVDTSFELENGAVIVTYQSQIPGFRGRALSSDESLQQTAAVRLISKMIKEPCFNELRTKQQLGYIVSSYYDVNYSSRQPDFFESSKSSQLYPLTSSIDSLVIYVLSRKEKPTEVASRIDDFLLNFKSRLEEMPEEEIREYADSLAKALTKPIRKLGDEASNHMAKLRRYAPETLIEGSGYTVSDLPWDNAEVMAAAIKRLDRESLLRVYDTLVVKKESRSRLVSFVYGKTFPFEVQPTKLPSWSGGKLQTIEEVMAKRKSLLPFDPMISYKSSGRSLWNIVGKHKTTMKYAFAGALVVGVGVWALKGKDDGKKQK